MPDYAIFGHSRTSIGRWLGVVSVILTSALSSLFLWLYKATNIECSGQLQPDTFLKEISKSIGD